MGKLRERVSDAVATSDRASVVNRISDATAANPTVFVVEDDRANREVLCVLLQQMGYATAVADSGHEALRQIEGGVQIDVVISDVVMPGMNGIDLARHVRELRPGVPIILVTGDADAVDTVIASGSVALLKPYTSEALQRILVESLASPRLAAD
jgi:CheY-like chemotaxis protein